MEFTEFGADENELIGEIYEAALDPSQWKKMLLHLRALSDVKDCNLIFHDQQGRFRNAAISSTVPDSVRDEYLRYHITDDIRFARLLHKYSTNGSDVVSASRVEYLLGRARAELQGEELFRWFESKLQYGDQVVLLLLEENYSTGFLSVNREVGQSLIEPRTHLLLDRLKPHLKRAMAIHHQLSTERLERLQLQQVFEGSAAGVLLLNGDGRVAWANREALRVVDKGDRLRIARSGALVCVAREQDVALQTAVRQSIELQHRQVGRSATTLALAHPDYRQPLQLSVVPVLVSADSQPMLRQVPALVFLIDPARRWTVSDAYMREAYGLTPAECDISAALSGGATVRQVAERRAVSEGTVREQVQNILDKTASLSQRELALLLFNLREDFSQAIG